MVTAIEKREKRSGVTSPGMLGRTVASLERYIQAKTWRSWGNELSAYQEEDSSRRRAHRGLPCCWQASHSSSAAHPFGLGWPFFSQCSLSKTQFVACLLSGIFSDQAGPQWPPWCREGCRIFAFNNPVIGPVFGALFPVMSLICTIVLWSPRGPGWLTALQTFKTPRASGREGPAWGYNTQRRWDL